MNGKISSIYNNNINIVKELNKERLNMIDIYNEMSKKETNEGLVTIIWFFTFFHFCYLLMGAPLRWKDPGVED